MTENEIREMVQSLRNRLETFASSGWAIDGLINDYTKSADTIEKLFEEIQQYRAMGTIEEFKALKEKNEPKEPDYEGDGCWGGRVVIDTWICPNCEKHYEVDYDDYDYCPNCGQHIDHSGLTEDD